MEINASNLKELNTAVSTRYKDVYNASVSNDWQKIALTYPMTTTATVFPWLEQIAGLREWVGPRLVNHIAAGKLAVTTKDYEATYAIPKKAVEDDQFGLYTGLLDQIAVMAAKLPGQLIEELFENSASYKWLADGEAFFGTSRKYGTNAISNKSTNALNAANLKTAIDAMKAYKGHGGKSLNVKPAYLVHGPALDWTAKELLENNFVGTNGDNNPNPLYHMLEDVSLSGITGNKWFVLADGAVKAVGYFLRREPSAIVSKTQLTDDNVFFENEFLWGADGRACAELMLPHMIYGSFPA